MDVLEKIRKFFISNGIPEYVVATTDYTKIDPYKLMIVHCAGLTEDITPEIRTNFKLALFSFLYPKEQFAENKEYQANEDKIIFWRIRILNTCITTALYDNTN